MNEFLRNGLDQLQYEKVKELVIGQQIAACYGQGSETPTLLFLAGAPNSGKSTIFEAGVDYFGGDHYIIIAQDHIKSEMQRLLKVPEHIVNEWRHEFQSEAWIITRETLLALLDLEINIIFDSTLGNINKYLDIIKYIDQEGLNYTYELDVVYAPLDELYRRNSLRTGHHIKEDIIQKIFMKLPSNIITILPYLSRVTCWDNSIYIDADTPNRENILASNLFCRFLIDFDSNDLAILNWNDEKMRLFFGDNYEDVLNYFKQFNVYEYE